MLINSIFLESYGKFTNQSVELNQGLNIVYGKNEDGKSTIRSFISYLLMSLQYPYLKDSIKEKFGNYQPFDSDEFRGYLLCDNLHNRKSGQIKVYQDFNNMDAPMIVDDQGQEIHISSEEIDVISFQELQGSKGKVLLTDILSRMENFKTSNLYGVGAKEVMTFLEAKLEDEKRKLLNFNNSDERHTVQDFFSDYDIKKQQYNQLTKEYYQLMKRVCDEQKLIESIESEAKSEIEGEAKLRYKQVIKIDDQINEIDKELKSLKEYFDANMDEAEKDLKNEKTIEALINSIQEFKNKVLDLKAEADVLKRNRSHQSILKLANPESITSLRDTLKILIERYEEVTELADSIEAYNVEKANLCEIELGNSEILIKDCYKYDNLKKYKEMVKEKIAFLDSALEGDASNKKEFFQPKISIGFIGLSLIILGLGSGLYILYQNLLYLIPMGIGFASLLLFVYFFTKSNQGIKEYNKELHRIRNEYEKYNEIISKNNEKVQNIFHKHNCEKEEEFQNIAIIIKEKRTMIEDIDMRIREKREMLNRREYGLALSGIRIEEIDSEYNIQLFTLIKQPYELKDMLEKYIDESQKYIKIIEEIQKVEKSIRKKKKEHDLIIKSRNNINQINSKTIEEKTKVYQSLKYDREKLARKMEAVLQGTDIEELKSLTESIDQFEMNNHSFNSFTKEESLVKVISMKEESLANSRELNRVKVELNELKNYFDEAKMKERERSIYEDQIKDINEKIIYISLAIDTIDRTSKTISEMIGETIENKVSEIVFQITKKYSKVMFNEGMDLIFYNEMLEEWKPVSQLSLGTIDQIYFALRLSIAELFQGENAYPLIFDDSFVQYDRKRLANVMNYLSTLKRQIIILSCHGREEKIANTLGLDYNAITLS